MPPANTFTVIAFDRASSRSFDALSGHLHVKLTNISKATVNPYLGREINGADEMGLDPERIYMLLRHPDELAKAAQSFDGKPLLEIHKPMFAADHDHAVTVGSVSGVVYDHPYLKANLAVWSDKAIKAIEDETQKELSCGYGYTADMTSGTYEGVRYDGIMRNIRGNHVSLVAEGRAGKDVVVGDSLENITMAKHALSGAAAQTQGALAVYLMGKLAADAKVDLRPAVTGLTTKNFKARQGKLAHDVKKLTTGKLAADASIDDVAEVIEALSEILPEEVPEVVEEMGGTEEETGVTTDEDGDDDIAAKLAAAGVPEAIIAKVMGEMNDPAPAMDADKDDKKIDDDKKDKPAMDRNTVTTQAMDAAIRSAVNAAEKRATERVLRTQQEIRDAERAVRSRAGDVIHANDSAASVYRAALTNMGVDHSEVPDTGVRALFNAIPEATPQRSKPVLVAQDAAASKEFDAMFPHANRLKN
ncbi:DUF2213 domain-containing protein [Methylobacterium sp. P1-11]|uniref:DUF2213 domain-containing protein n=1 Tax=Methylobacterium sp. P1-11 TaxID=2024616 RepID=UPI0011EF943A|nr:DUF2213 domain-containing protein [Methylobacterium sp. P1-11]KAA0117871.1 DUF2213 domain-containing protein [Methylobacterium sp. P1-11]